MYIFILTTYLSFALLVGMPGAPPAWRSGSLSAFGCSFAPSLVQGQHLHRSLCQYQFETTSVAIICSFAASSRHTSSFFRSIHRYPRCSPSLPSNLSANTGSDLLVDAHMQGVPVDFFHLTGHLVTTRTTNGGRDRGQMLAVLFAFFVLFTNIIVRGLISMQTLLENPFGSHPCKFPLTSQAQDHVKNTVAMLLVRPGRNGRI